MRREIAQSKTSKAKRTEEALRESEEKFRTLVINAPVGLSIIAKDGTYEYVNPKFGEMFGYTLEDIPTGRKWFEKAYPDREYRQKAIACWLEDVTTAKKGETRPRTFTVSCKDGSEKEIFFRSAALTDGRQLVTYEDVTERKRAEEAFQKEKPAVQRLAEGRELVAKIGRIISSTLEIDKVYELFAEEVGKAIPFDRIAINIIDLERGTHTPTYVTGNDAGRRAGDVVPLTGTCTQEVMRTGSSQLIQEDDIEKVKEHFPGLSPLFQAGVRSFMAVPLISKDQVIGVLNFGALKQDAYADADVKLAESIGNQIAGAIASSELYAERKRAEEELKKSEERYRRLVEDIDDGYFIIQDGRFVYINQAFANLSGYSKKSLLGKEFSRFFPREYSERLSRNDPKRRASRKLVGQREFEISRKDGGSLVVEIRSRIIEYSGRSAIAGICKDITERKRAEMTLKEKVKELERWYRLTVDREVKMIQLKKRIQELESQLKPERENQND
jgi:PAS domain S-box-containing protein